MISIIIPVQKLKKSINPRFFYKKVFGFEETLNSIISNLKLDFEIIVIINDGESALLEFVQANPFITRYCIISDNVGVSRAWNIGAQMAVGDLLCFCNDDVEFASNSFEDLITVLQMDNKIGQIGPEGGRWHLNLSGQRLGLKKVEVVDEVSGFFFIIPRNIYIKAGGFDVNYTPAGCEEIDMSFKIRSMGYKCVVVPNTGIVHHGFHGVSSKKTDIKYLSTQISSVDLDKRNKDYFVDKWYKDGKLIFDDIL